jgi:cytochrome c-type biogenesis protein CcmE
VTATAAPPVAAAPRARRKTNRTRLMIAAFVVLAALAFLVFRGLGNATLYFRTADEAIAHRTDLGERRFRLEGTVVPGTIQQVGETTNFSVTSKGVTVDVHNSGQPVGIFREDIPVVLEGHFAAGSNLFQSDRIMVKHSADYQEEHPDRVTGAAGQ